MASYRDRKAAELIDLGDKLFRKKERLDLLNDEVAWQFAPDLCNFTRDIELGDDFMGDHMDSTPVILSRELSSQLSAWLRPQDKLWFKTTTLDDEMDAVEENARFLERLTKQVWRGIYDPRTQMIASTKEADRFYVNFGQAVLSINEAPGTREHLFFKNFHTKDCAWLENDIGEVDHLHRKQSMTARALVRRFGGERNNLHESIRKAAIKEPDREFQIRVVTLPADEYAEFTGKRAGGKLPYVIAHIDIENGCVIRDSGLVTFNYVVPRWHRFAGSQYAFSPATMTALPDARMAQMLAQIILEAGEKAIDPPLIGKQEVVIGQPNIMAGALTWVDIAHDGKLSEAIEALQIDPDMRVGFEMRKDVREMLARAFFIDKLALPETSSETTAFEIARRLEEHTRNLLPLFEPMQIEYNTRLLDKAFSFLVNMKKIDLSGMPEAIANMGEFSWSFESPIQQARYRIMVEQFRDTMQVVAGAREMGLMASPVHLDLAVRDAVRGVDGPASWRKTKAEQDEEAAANQQKADMAEALAAATAAGQAGTQLGEAGQKMGVIPPGGPMMPSVDQAIPSESGIPSNAGGTGMPTQSNAMRAIQQQLQQLQGGAGGEQLALPAPGGGGMPMGPGQAGGAPAMATPAGGMGDIVAMQRRIMMRLADLEAAINEPREIKVERDEKGRVKGAKTQRGGSNGQRPAA